MFDFLSSLRIAGIRKSQREAKRTQRRSLLFRPSLLALEDRVCPAPVTVSLDFDTPATGSELGSIPTPYGSIFITGELSQGAVPGGSGNGLRSQQGSGAIIIQGGLVTSIEYRYGGFAGAFTGTAKDRFGGVVDEFNDPDTTDAGSEAVAGPINKPGKYIRRFTFFDPAGARADIDDVRITFADVTLPNC